MPDILSEFKPLDPGRIDIEDVLELQYWGRELGCNEADVLRAVAEVGNHVTEVRDWLATRH